MKISVFIVEPRLKGDFTRELKDCVDQIESENISNRIISTTVFINALDNGGYNKCLESVNVALCERLKDVRSVNCVAQPPVNGNHLAFEIHLINVDDWTLDFVDFQGNSYVRAVKDGLVKGIFVSGLQCGYTGGVTAAYNTVFASMDEILTREGLSFHNVVRQWNYVEHIVKEVQMEGLMKQHYQIFNDIRSAYYNRASFTNGYPAATGIGMNAGGVTLSFYALPDTPDLQVFQIDNPCQQPAFDYPDDVLVGAASVDHVKTTPKFVRAKYIKTEIGHTTFISGTAAIRNSKTVAVNNMLKQLQVTLENIEYLISPDNMVQAGIKKPDREQITFYRGYVKNSSCIGEITKSCEELLPGVPYLILVSDICRQDLLIEIEGFSS